MSYYFPLPNNITDFVSLMVFANNVTNYMFGIGILLMIFFLSFTSLLFYGSERAFSTSIFLTFISSLFLASMGLIAYEIILIMIFATALSIFLLWKFGD